MQDVSEGHFSQEPKASTVLKEGFHSIVLDVVSVSSIDYVGMQCLRQVMMAQPCLSRSGYQTLIVAPYNFNKIEEYIV